MYQIRPYELTPLSFNPVLKESFEGVNEITDYFNCLPSEKALPTVFPN